MSPRGSVSACLALAGLLAVLAWTASGSAVPPPGSVAMAAADDGQAGGVARSLLAGTRAADGTATKSAVAGGGAVNANGEALSEVLFSGRTLFAMSLTSLASVLAAAGGLGGGGLFVPLFILTLELLPSSAIPLSKAMIFGGALANLQYNLRRRAPSNPARTLINFEVRIASLCVPLLILGAA